MCNIKHLMHPTARFNFTKQLAATSIVERINDISMNYPTIACEQYRVKILE